MSNLKEYSSASTDILSPGESQILFHTVENALSIFNSIRNFLATQGIIPAIYWESNEIVIEWSHYGNRSTFAVNVMDESSYFLYSATNGEFVDIDFATLQELQGKAISLIS